MFQVWKEKKSSWWIFYIVPDREVSSHMLKTIKEEAKDVIII